MQAEDIKTTFSSGNFELVAGLDPNADWRVQVARGLIGDPKAALQQLESNSFDPELEFFRAALLWLNGEGTKALEVLATNTMPQAANLAALIRKNKINVLVQLHPMHREFKADSLFRLMVVGTDKDGIEIEPYLSLEQQLKKVIPSSSDPFIPDYFLCTSIEQNDLPLDLAGLSFPTFAWTDLDSRYIQSSSPWLKAFDYLITPCRSIHEQVRKSIGRTVFSLPFSFQIGQDKVSNFERLLFLLGIFSTFPRLPREQLQAVNLAYKEPSFYKEAFSTKSASCARRLYALARVKEALNGKNDYRPFLDSLRALILDYGRTQYIPAISSIGMKSSEPSAYRMIDELSSLAQQAFPRVLLVRFNTLRFFLHFGEGRDVQKSVRVIVEILSMNPNIWEISPQDDVLPYDFFPLFFDAERYLSLAKDTYLTGQDHIPELKSIIYSALFTYLGAYVDEVPHLSRALELNPEFRPLQYRFAEALLRHGNVDKALILLERLSNGSGQVALSSGRLLESLHSKKISQDRTKYSELQLDDRLSIDEEFEYSRLMPLLPKVGVLPGGFARAI